MKKIIIYFAVIFITAFLLFSINRKNKNYYYNESRGIFLSYIEYLEYFQGKDCNNIKKQIDNIMVELKHNYINRIYLQVRPFSDSIYNSNIFPFSHTISGVQGEDIGLDVLDYFLKVAHKENIEIHAWINPYRISNYTDISFLSEDNPAFHWLKTNHVKIIEGKGIYYNPASSEVKELIINGVIEIVKKYDVDGILFDDYFYPDNTIDLDNYKEVENTISLTDFRLSQVNELVSNIYKKIKEINSDILFGISPDGNINNNYDDHYADVKKWISEDGYVDYIMPQIYYGFIHESKPFIATINEWNNLIKNKVKLIPALALYKSGESDLYAGSGINEWVEEDDIIKKQIQVSRNMSNYIGFSIFRYDYLIRNQKSVNLQNEIYNFQSLFSGL